MVNQKQKTRELALYGMFIAIEMIFGLTPIGFIPTPLLTVVTVHIPVILGAIMIGPKMGATLGFVFGLTSLINATFLKPNPIESPAFSPFYSYISDDAAFSGGWQSLVICFIPRILTGLVAAYVFILLRKAIKYDIISAGIAAVLGSLTNTLLVLFGIYFLIGEPYANAYGMSMDVLLKTILGIISFNGIIEAVSAAVIAVLVCKPLLKVKDKLFNIKAGA